MAAAKPPVPVRAGQIWADTHYGSKGRTVRILEVDSARALVEVATDATGPGAAKAVGRRRRVLYDHRGLRGYRLVNEGEQAPTRRTAEEDRALHAHVATLRRVKLTLNENEIWVLYRLVVAERSDDRPTLLPDLPEELEHAMGMALAKLSSAQLDLNTPKEGDI